MGFTVIFSEAGSDGSGPALTGKSIRGKVLDILPTAGDLAHAMLDHVDRIIDRTTVQHVDIHGKPFHPYSKRPYIWYPQGRPVRKQDNSREFMKKVKYAARHRGIGPERVTPSGGIRFESYEAFKAAIGSTGVDLKGPGPRNMLSRMDVTVNGRNIGPRRGKLSRMTEPAIRAEISFSEEDKSLLAEVHNEGNHRMPQREFFGASRRERVLMRRKLQQLAKDRI